MAANWMASYSIEIVIVPLKDRIAETNFFLGGRGVGINITAERITQLKIESSTVKINTVTVKE